MCFCDDSYTCVLRPKPPSPHDLGQARDGNKICAFVGPDLMGVSGFGDSVHEALADPAANLIQEAVWIEVTDRTEWHFEEIDPDKWPTSAKSSASFVAASNSFSSKTATWAAAIAIRDRAHTAGPFAYRRRTRRSTRLWVKPRQVAERDARQFVTDRTGIPGLRHRIFGYTFHTIPWHVPPFAVCYSPFS
jgi:hypothetical protein